MGLKEILIFDYEMNQILELIFRRDSEIGDLKTIFRIILILTLLAIINPKLWVVLLGILTYLSFFQASIVQHELI